MSELAGVEPCPAVQYLRTSSDHRQYALENQRRRIADFAAAQGYNIVQTYLDDARSGLTLRQRPGLNRLLRDVIDPGRTFSTILVLDVSRWGRFQDVDEHAAYEFLCRQMGVAIQYVGEPFINDDSFEASMMKHMKRVIAGEYSRDLSTKISYGQVSAARCGYKQGGPSVFGLRRCLVDAKGRPKQELKDGQWKSLADDRVVFVPGPADEQAVVRRMFDMCLEGFSLVGIARHLNHAGVSSTRGTPWSQSKVRTALKNELYVGDYVFNRSSGKLKAARQANPPELWIRVPVCEGIVDRDVFKRVQDVLATPRTGKGKRYDPDKMLDALKGLLARHGRLSSDLIDASPDVPSSETYRTKFGSLGNAYAQVGYRALPVTSMEAGTKPVRGGKPYTRTELLDQLQRALEAHTYLDTGVLLRCTFTASINTYVTAFGSMDEACRQIGYTGWRYRPARKIKYKKSSALKALRRVFKGHGYINPTLLKGNPSVPSDAWFRAHFGTLAKACEAAGIASTAFTPSQKSSVSIRLQYLADPEGGAAPVHGRIGQMPDDRLLAGARRIYSTHGFINRELIANDPEMPSVYGILKRYASLAHFYAAAGLPTVMSYQRATE